MFTSVGTPLPHLTPSSYSFSPSNTNSHEQKQLKYILYLSCIMLFCDKVCQWVASGQWFSPGILVTSANKTDHYDITEILLKVVKHHNPNPMYAFNPFGYKIVHNQLKKVLLVIYFCLFCLIVANRNMWPSRFEKIKKWRKQQSKWVKQ